MAMGNVFFAVFLGTVLLIRAALFIRPTSGITVLGVRIHHYVYGLIGTPVGIILHSLPLYAVSIAVLVDELTFVLIAGSTHEDNYSLTSIVGTLGFILLVYLLRRILVSPL
jgi:hypothetical protein